MLKQKHATKKTENAEISKSNRQVKILSDNLDLTGIESFRSFIIGKDGKEKLSAGSSCYTC